MEHHHIEVPKTARYFTLGPTGEGLGDVWYVCHGYRQLAGRFIRRFARLDDGSRRIIAPEGLSRFYVDPTERAHGPADRVGAAWMTRDDREVEIQDYVRYLDLVAAKEESELAERPRRVVVGFSQGVHTACRWTILGSLAPEALILWGAYPPRDLDAALTREKLSSTRLVLVRGTADRYTSEERQAEQEAWLTQEGIPFQAFTHPGGHEIDRDLLDTLAAAI